jgi:hypothetical protein
VLEPNRFWGLHGLSDLQGRILDPKQPWPSAYTEGLWGFLLTELVKRSIERSPVGEPAEFTSARPGEPV